MSDFYVYALDRADKQEICYIGKGCGDRKDFHAKIGSRHYNKILRSIFNKTEVTARILVDCLAEEAALSMERELIALYGRKNIGTGILANLTDGGDGGVGRA